MTDEEILDEIRCALKDAVEHQSEAGKPERERWVLIQFLQNLGVDFTDEEVLPQSNNPPDVIFRGDGYEIKEVLDAGRRRHAEYKAAYKMALETTNPADLVERISIEDMTPDQIGELISEKLKTVSVGYEPRFRASLNLIFYVNLEYHSLKIGPMPAPDSLSTFGWRSISVLMGWDALVFFTNSKAPDFLRVKTGTVTLRESKKYSELGI